MKFSVAGDRGHMTVANRAQVFIITVGCKKTSVSSVENFPLSNSANNNGVGASAKELLIGTKPKLLIKIQYMARYELQQQTLINLSSFLKTYINKTDVQVSQREIQEAGGDIKSLADIARIEQQHRTAFNSNDQVSAYVLITNSFYTTDNVLGAAFRNTSIGIFGKIIQQHYAGLDQSSKVRIESRVLQHEFGHLLGLVDLGSPMQANHKDDNNGNHYTSATCLMDYGVETAVGLAAIGNVPLLDANCRNDLKANGGK